MTDTCTGVEQGLGGARAARAGEEAASGHGCFHCCLQAARRSCCHHCKVMLSQELPLSSTPECDCAGFIAWKHGVRAAGRWRNYQVKGAVAVCVHAQTRACARAFARVSLCGRAFVGAFVHANKT